MARVGVAWKAAILVGRRSRLWVRGLWVRVARDEKLRKVVLLGEALTNVCRSSEVRAIDAISAIHDKLQREMVLVRLTVICDAEGGRSRESCQHAYVYGSTAKARFFPRSFTQHSLQTTTTYPPSILSSIRYSPLPCRNGFAADSPEPRTGSTQPRRLDEVDRAAEKDLCHAGQPWRHHRVHHVEQWLHGIHASMLGSGQELTVAADRDRALAVGPDLHRGRVDRCGQPGRNRHDQWHRALP